MKYKSAQDIFDSVQEELDVYAQEGKIDTSKLIKVIKECNAFLNLDINDEKNVLLEVKNYKVKLPNDFIALNFAILCKIVKYSDNKPSGFQVEYKDVTCKDKSPCALCTCESDCGEFVIFQKCPDSFVEYTYYDLVKLVGTPTGVINSGCFNLTAQSINEISIKNGWLYSNFESGFIYINYVSDMVDEDGNLLVIDHDLINPYYEASCIYKIYRTLYSNHEGDELQRMQFWKQELKEAKALAANVRSTPEYNVLTDLFRHNRKKFYNKYIRYFETL